MKSSSTPPSGHRRWKISSSRSSIVIAIVSGREMWDLRRRIGIPGIVYAGEHGMEIRGRDACR